MMKIYCSAIFLLSIVISASATSLENKLVAATSLSWDNDYFLGDWKAWGYGCDNQTPPNELFNVYHENGQFFAKKTLGDNCVTTGTVSFRGALPANGFSTGKNYPVTFTLGNKQRPNSSFGNTNLQIQDVNRFSAPAWGLRYERLTPYPLRPKVVVDPVPVAPVAPVAPVIPEGAFPSNYFLGDWKAWGYGCDNETPVNELFNVYYDNTSYYAKKTLGDNCVTTGTVSFKGSLQPYWKINTNYPATYTLGNKQRPNSSFGNTNIRIQDINRFSAPAWGLRYERITPVAPVVPVAPVTPTRRCRKL